MKKLIVLICILQFTICKSQDTLIWDMHTDTYLTGLVSDKDYRLPVPRVQQSTWTKYKRPVGIIVYHVGTVALGAIADAQFDEGNKNLSHAMHATEVALLLSGPFVFNIKRSEAISYLLTYGFLRFSFFDYCYAAARDLPITYLGDTSAYDRFFNQFPPHGVAFAKTLSFSMGIAIPIKYF